MSDKFVLRTYFRSTAAYRVRIALNLKGADYRLLPVNLLKGEQKSAEYKQHNPEGLVPTLEAESAVLTQSMAILEYIEESIPAPALLPRGPIDRAQVRAFAQSIACDIHPLNNLRVLKYLVNDMGVSEEEKLTWYHHWIKTGFTSLEARLANNDHGGPFCFGETPSIADVCLVPQVYNANRFNCPLDDYPNIRRIEAHCLTLPAFEKARPEHQPDAN